MLLQRFGLVAALALAGACSATPPYEPASRAAVSPQTVGPADFAVTAQYSVGKVEVIVPRSLTVNERNAYYPKGDIVWREDPIGDRHAQVEAIVKNAIEAGVAGLDGPRKVDLRIEVTKFHGLSERARYTVGGVHAIQFFLTLVDPETGEALAEPRFVKADFDALGGQAAVAAESRGITQKLRITRHLARVIQVELTQPGGFRSEANGLIAALNQI